MAKVNQETKGLFTVILPPVRCHLQVVWDVPCSRRRTHDVIETGIFDVNVRWMAEHMHGSFRNDGRRRRKREVRGQISDTCVKFTYWLCFCKCCKDRFFWVILEPGKTSFFFLLFFFLFFFTTNFTKIIKAK